MKLPAIKGIISSLLLLLIICLAITGTILYFGKTGMIWGIPRNVLRNAHTVMAVSMCILVVVHIVLNFRMYRAELRALVRKKTGKND